MSRTRILAVAASIVALVGAMLIEPPTLAASSSRPQVGQCRNTTFAESYNNYSDTRPPIPCSRPHGLQTFAVGDVLPKNAKYYALTDAQISRAAENLCTRPFWKALGATHSVRMRSAYSWNFFIPTAAQYANGARWIRCDVSLTAVSTTDPNVGRYLPLPRSRFPLIGSRALNEITRRCLADDSPLSVTSCSQPHVGRAYKTFIIASHTRPSQAAIRAQANARCPGAPFISPRYIPWKFGDHVIVCFSKTTH